MSTPTELLKRVLVVLDELYEYGILEPKEEIKVREEIRNYLAAEKEAEPEPVAWTNQHELNALGTDVTCYMYSEPSFGEMFTENDIPLYTRPEPNPSESIKNQEVDRTRKPMTPKERSDSYIELEETIGPDAHLLSFLSGIAAAERYHGIEAKDPKPSGDYVLGEGSPYFKENT